MSSPEHSPLGKSTVYADRYDAGLLFPIPRQEKRDEIGVSDADLPFHGVDIWNGYELSWLDARGKPVVAVAEFRFPATTPNIVESKSFKLYLNGFAQERMADASLVRDTLVRDLSTAAGGPVTVVLRTPEALDGTPLGEPEGILLDAQDLDFDSYGPPRAEFLGTHEGHVREVLVSHLLRSNCPVTGQPDWGSVQISYTGAPIDRAGLLRYLVSFRNHTEFHEQCVERIFMDLSIRCVPEALSVYARYTRRGGLDINPFRSTDPAAVPGNPRGARQ
ncbi:NADPH-dependent 7-cyano-7-deazaguanine reductase QueF [Luteibacter yeojuensis]|uniref:NADPH-dependent 7-cyano-7-deazaguanine reductase n=1 Tax=Luteibacter yeojuensis TaxID=345309 RepID=A0A7X5TR95_9GAMM|nr:NADPH-dependent 7-cyano-7-deazaguanine reductase QueF [Luteibacter yeojuensis]NID17356.1 NADPH-dependent 7-cyano-7-deazaguanine reductase QueF [Luteibacter yeojuensis]